MIPLHTAHHYRTSSFTRGHVCVLTPPRMNCLPLCCILFLVVVVQLPTTLYTLPDSDLVVCVDGQGQCLQLFTFAHVARFAFSPPATHTYTFSYLPPNPLPYFCCTTLFIGYFSHPTTACLPPNFYSYYPLLPTCMPALPT